MSQVLVTGANRGIGLEFTRQLLQRGDHVIATCRDPQAASALHALGAAHPGHLLVWPLVLPDAGAIAALRAELDAVDLHLDLLLNNAGVLPPGERFGAVTAQVLAATFAANASGPFLLTQALAPRLAPAARVVNLSSRLGSIGATERFGTPSYALSKAALNMATRQLAHALAPQGAVVVAVSPGWVRTDMGGSQANLAPDEAVAALLGVIDGLGPDDNGRFIGTDGASIVW